MVDPASSSSRVPDGRAAIRTSLVRSGTSRFIVVDRRDLPAGMADRHVAAGLFGDTIADGLGGDHYQLNKLAIWIPTGPNEVEFTFFSLAPGTRSVAQGAECGHAAVAVARVAAEAIRTDGRLVVRNADTGQRMAVDLDPEGGIADGDRTGTVVYDPPLPPVDASRMGPLSGRDGDLGWEIVHAGNVFALVPGSRTCDDADLRRLIQAETLDWARRTGVSNASPEFVRTISYDIRWISETSARIEATCHNGDQRHNSLPISGNVALCNHVAHLRIRDLAATSSTDDGDLAFSFETRSQGGVENVGVDLARRPEGWMIRSTSSTTNVRLLFRGTAFIAP